MATRNIVPRANEEGNIGTTLKNWLKGWFKDLFVSGDITDGVNSISVAKIPEEGVWADYSETSTLVGWSSTAAKLIRYKKIGKTVFVNFWIDGTSDSATTTFTVPYTTVTAASGYFPAAGFCYEGAAQTLPMSVYIASNSAIVILSKTFDTIPFATSGVKNTYGQFWYESV